MIPHVDRQPAQPNRRQIIPEGGGTPTYVTVAYADEPTVDGTLINKAVLDEFLAATGITTGTASALVLVQEGFVLADGASIRIRPHVAITNAAATLNVAGTGAKSIIKMTGSAILRIAQNAWVTLVYSEPLSAWILQSDMAQDPTLTSLNMAGNITMNNNYIDGALYR